jgi:hypothetical protein
MANEGPTIWIVNDSGHPFEKALDLIPEGTLRRFTVGSVNPLRLDRLNFGLAEGVAYAKESDYIIVSGTPMISTMVAVLWFLRFNEARFLQWNAKKREYELATVTREGLENLLERFMMPNG